MSRIPPLHRGRPPPRPHRGTRANPHRRSLPKRCRKECLRLVVLAGGILCGIAWAMNAYADSLAFLYVAAAVGGLGAGAVYGTCGGREIGRASWRGRG